MFNVNGVLPYGYHRRHRHQSYESLRSYHCYCCCQSYRCLSVKDCCK